MYIYIAKLVLSYGVLRNSDVLNFKFGWVERGEFLIHKKFPDCAVRPATRPQQTCWLIQPPRPKKQG